MTLQIPPGFSLVGVPFQHSASARRSFCTFGVDQDPSLASPIAVADAVATAFYSGFTPSITQEVTLGPVEVRSNFGGGPIFAVGTTTGDCTSVTDTVSVNTAVLVSKSTLTPGRTGRGRMFVPWWAPDGNVDEVGIISTATRNSFQAIVDQLLVDLTTEGVPMVLLHNGVGSPSAVAGLTVSPLVASQRRRLGR